ncbi:MAG: hypothetical protein HY770_05855 [Chitinivibrionia bacterium]|nr:hypothetical protein [Chitinivibrionia bacterium]
MNKRSIGIPIQLMAIVLFGCTMAQQSDQARKSNVQFMPMESDNRIYYEPRAENIARIVASYLPESIATVERELQRPFVKPVQVKIFESADSFAAVTDVSKQEWGVMISGTVFLSGLVKTAPDDHIKALLTHELVHLYLQQRLGVSERHPTLPMWFEEGLAELVSGGSAMAMVTEPEATRAIMAGQHFFSDAAGGLVHPERCKYGLESHMFYRQAEMFVAYLQSLDGTKFQSLLLALADGHDFEGSWRSILGFSLHDAWQKFMGELESRARDPLNKERR